MDANFFAVLLHGERVGTLHQTGDYTRFSFNETYLGNPIRSILGLRFEEQLRTPYESALRLPPWFSNLLPEGPLREWIAADRGVAMDREMELLAQVGHDLPGAVQVMPADGPDEHWVAIDGEASERTVHREQDNARSPWKFSLAGVALKFSMLAKGDRLTVPAASQHGDWLVKFPDYRYPNVPLNEFAMMSLARSVGIDVPEIRMVHRDELNGVPARMWPNEESMAYAVRRFDRLADEHRTAVHIEDFAQVRDKYPRSKYDGSFETVAAVAYRGHDVASLEEMVRRLAYSVMIGNGDAHLKNWSLIYRDKLMPVLAPAYDLVSTIPYHDGMSDPEDLGLKFGKSKRFEMVRISSFGNLQTRLAARFGEFESDLAAIAEDTARRVIENWPSHREILEPNSDFISKVTDWMQVRRESLLKTNG